jgi:sugar phosphate isomerase/epimerase
MHLGGTARSPEEVGYLHGLGLEFAEIPVANADAFAALIQTYRLLREKLGIYFLCHGPNEGDPNNRQSLEKDYLPKILAAISLMSELESPLLTIHLWMDSRFVRPENIRFKLRLLADIIGEAEERGITICLENLSERASDLVEAFETLPLLCFTLDLGHAQLLTDRNRGYEFMENFPERIRHVHLHDNRGGDSHLADLHLPPGEGIIEFEKLFEGLRNIGYSKTVTIELRPDQIEKSIHRIRELVSGRAARRI